MPLFGRGLPFVYTAHIMALAGERALVVDGDLRRPAIYKVLNMGNDRGLSNMVVGGNGFVNYAGSVSRVSRDGLTTGERPMIALDVDAPLWHPRSRTVRNVIKLLGFVRSLPLRGKRILRTRHH